MPPDESITYVTQNIKINLFKSFTISIDVFGNIKLCNMDSGDDFRLNMGNVLEISIECLI